MTSYRMDVATHDEMAADDPFGGLGIFLPAPGTEGLEILADLERVFGPGLSAVAWPDKGAWIEGDRDRALAAEMLALWERRNS